MLSVRLEIFAIFPDKPSALNLFGANTAEALLAERLESVCFHDNTK